MLAGNSRVGIASPVAKMRGPPWKSPLDGCDGPPLPSWNSDTGLGEKVKAYNNVNRSDYLTKLMYQTHKRSMQMAFMKTRRKAPPSL